VPRSLTRRGCLRIAAILTYEKHVRNRKKENDVVTRMLEEEGDLANENQKQNRDRFKGMARDHVAACRDGSGRQEERT